MKAYKFLIAALMLISIAACKKDNYPGGEISPYISIFDLRGIYKGKDVILSRENMFGSDKLNATVISDHRQGNMPAGLLIVQDKRRLNMLRGIAIDLGNDAASYLPGDSLSINIAGATLTRKDSMLVLKGVQNSNIQKLATGTQIAVPLVRASSIIQNPELYESTLLMLTRVGFDPSYPAGSTYSGKKVINDGFANMILSTEAGATFANNPIPYSANFTGIVFRGLQDTVPSLRIRSLNDITVLAANAPKIAPAIITGFLHDANGSDVNYEYVQLLATKNIDFAVTKMSIVTTNNAGTSTPIGFPVNGWATGGLRTYKIDITSGTVQRGQYFYVGGLPNINGSGSTTITSRLWVNKDYNGQAGDGFGTATANLLANSGNAAGIALFDLTAVTNDTVPVDVVFFGGAGSLYTPGPPEKGYKITNNDYYDVKHPTTLDAQPYFMQGTNTARFGFPGASKFAQLGGKYNYTTGRWTTARQLTGVTLTTTSALTEIEGATILEQ